MKKSGTSNRSFMVDGKNIATMITVTNFDGEIIYPDDSNGTYTVDLKGRDHLMIDRESGNQLSLYVSADGKSISYGGSILKLEGDASSDTDVSEDITDLKGAIITPVEGSTVEAIKAGNPTTGDTIEYNGYIYKYNQAYFALASDWYDVASYSFLGDENAWGVRVADTTSSTYQDMESSIYNKPVGSLAFTFAGCTELTTAPKLSSNATSMYGCFNSCSKITTCDNIPSNVKLMNNTFINCTELTSVGTIPKSVENMEYAFENCSSLETMPVISGNNIDIDMAGTFKNCTALVNVQNIPYGVSKLHNTFEGCTSLEKMPTLPTTITDMKETFLGCTALKEVIAIPSSDTYTYKTFSGCTSLNDIQNILNSVSSIGYQMFYMCTGLTEITIPNSVTTIDDWAFAGCTNLTTIYYNGTATGEPWGATNATVKTE